MRWAAVAVACGVALSAAPNQLPSRASALDRFVQAASSADALALVDEVVASGVDVDTALARLRAGRSFPVRPAGTHTIRIATSDGTTIETQADVPTGYDPARRWPVRVQLHGGVSRPLEAGARPAGPNRIQGEEAIYLQPRGHSRAEWWYLNQFEHMGLLLDTVKRTYNVDDNRVYLTGVSDGATGAYFFAMKLPTPFSAFLPLNGNMRVLATPGTRANGQLYAGNLRNTPLFIINGGRDRLYPLSAVTPHVEMLQAAGVEVEFRPQPEAGHDTSWWPTEREHFARFVADHPRQPHPARVTMESERTDRYNRAHWLVLDQLGRRPSDDSSLEDVNRFGAAGEQRMFGRTFPSGRVDAERRGNTFEVRSRGVAAFTLLLSPDVVDLSQPVVVTVNGAVAFEGVVKPDLRTLLAWHARDADRTMLYTAALPIRVP